MNQWERLAFYTGGILLAIAAGVIFGEAGRARRFKRQPPVDELAERLKQAWAGYHTP